MNTPSIFQAIYENVFCKIYNNTCYVFLCGGAQKDNMRDKTRRTLEKSNIQILYPEDLFIEMLNQNKNSDLLEYENLLADNADAVCVICESMGSAVELGAFVQNDALREKLIVAVNQKYSRAKSFIMLGPVKNLKKQYPNHVLIYQIDKVDKFGKELAKQCKGFRTNSRIHSFEKLSAFIAFIPIILFFFDVISRKELYSSMKSFLKENGMLPENYNDLFNAAIKYLLKNNILVTDLQQRDYEAALSLSIKGYNDTNYRLGKSVAANKTVLHDKIRCDILKEHLNN